MPRHWRGSDKVFTAGISWDPREPLPAEFINDSYNPIPGHPDRRPDLPGQELAASHYAERPPSVPRDSLAVGIHDFKSGMTRPAVGVRGASTSLPRFTVQEPGRNVLPPLSVTADVSIVQDTAKVAVTQLFWNDSNAPLKEAAFTFPLPAGCTVTDFSCRIGTKRVIRGAVMPKEEARESFDRHLRNEDNAVALLDQETPEIFTTTLGNVPERTKVRVHLTYITLLKHRFVDSKNLTTLTIPTSIAPRYGEAPDGDANVAAAATDVRQGLTLEIEIVEAEKIVSVSSPSHAVAVERHHGGSRKATTFADLAAGGGGGGGGDSGSTNVERAFVRLENGPIFLDRDFVLDITTAPDGDNENPQAWLEEHPPPSNHKTLMLTIPPGYLAQHSPPMQRSEILFLADRSGSMEDKIETLKSAMRFFLKGIPQGRKFNICSFGTEFTSWLPTSVEYAEETMNSALSYIETEFKADMGSTELLPAIQAIVQVRDKTAMTDIIVLTDGEVWRLQETLEYIQKTRDRTEGRIRFFALGIGQAVSHALVDGIAKAGGGYSEVVQQTHWGRWEDRVVSMTKAALMTAHLGPIRLAFDIQDENGGTRSSTLANARRSPADTSAVNPFDRSRIYFHLDDLSETESVKSVQVELRTTGDDDRSGGKNNTTTTTTTTTIVIPVTVLANRDTTLHRLAARAMLDDLERGRSHIHLGPGGTVRGSWEERSMARREAKEIACRWSLVSKWTSFFLAEEEEGEEEEPCAPTVGENGFVGRMLDRAKPSPGENLLESRGNVQALHVAALEHVYDWDVGCFGSSAAVEHLYRPPPAATQWPVDPAFGRQPQGSVPLSFPNPPQDPGFQTAHAALYPSVPAAESQGLVPNTQDVVVRKRRRRTRMRIKHKMPLGYSSVEQKIREMPRPHQDMEVACIEVISPPGDKASDGQQQEREEEEEEEEEYKRSSPMPALSKGASPRMAGVPLLIHRREKRSGSPEPGPQALLAESDFVRDLLAFQQFDGAVDFGSWAAAEEVLGAAVSDALRELQQAHPGLTDKAVWTAAVRLLLQRDLQSCKALWGLMVLKMAEYCARLVATSVLAPDFLDLVDSKLKGLRLPIHEVHEHDNKEVEDGSPKVTTTSFTTTREPAFSNPGSGRDHKKKKKKKKKKSRKKRQAQEEKESSEANVKSTVKSGTKDHSPVKSPRWLPWQSDHKSKKRT
ncbi:hypothetical protein VTG60DRAFT_2347 [Thermothelomyces hinnuleus]